jgi:hypothetical protein
MTVAIALNDADLAWRLAIASWAAGDESRVLLQLSLDAPIPRFAREWIALGLERGAARRKGRRAAKPTAVQMLALFALFDPGRADGLPRTRLGYDSAGRILGVPGRTIEHWLPKTRSNGRGHRPYGK